MLGRMIAGGQPAAAQGAPSEAPDYIVTNDAEWDAVLANSAATLADKIVEVAAPSSAFTVRRIEDRDIWAAGGRLTIRSANSSSGIPGLAFQGTVRGVDLSGLNIQRTDWPAAGACVGFLSGTFGKIRFLNGTTIRHGYGPAQQDFDTSADLPEYERIDNVRTATATSTTYALTWKDPSFAKPTCWIEFFNRGSNSVRVEVGGAGVAATGSSHLVAAGARSRITGLNPATDTHFAILATSGTSEVNARTEIGLTEYLADALFSVGGNTIEDLEFRNCIFRDLSSGIKGPAPDSIIVMDCDFDRIYQDICAISGKGDDGFAYYLRNLECLPFSRSGIAEGLNGDAHDPHGDQFQHFGGGLSTTRNTYYAGNRIRVGTMRAGVGSQGVFVSDNDIVPSYRNLYFISTMQVGGAPNGIIIGETGFPVRDVMVYGASVVQAIPPSSTSQNVTIQTDSSATCYVGSTIAAGINFFGAGAVGVEENNLRTAPDGAAAIFPDIANLSSATTRAQIEAAMTTAGAGAGIGAVATRDAVNWTTTDHTAVIRWENIPSGAAWSGLTNQAIGSVITLPLRKILNRKVGQTVSVAAGTEWRSVASDGTTEVRAWTSNPGTIEPDQFIQIRRTSGPAEATVAASVTINGFVETVNITSQLAGPSVYLVQGSPVAYFQDTANPPAGVTRVTFRGKFFWPTGTLANGQTLFAQASDGCDLTTRDNGFRMGGEDGTQTAVRTTFPTVRAGSLTENVWLDIVFEVDQAAKTLALTVNGMTETLPFEFAGNGLFNTARRFLFLARSGGTSAIPNTVRVADLSVEFNGTLRKAIPNNAASANTDAWKLGGSLANG